MRDIGMGTETGAQGLIILNRKLKLNPEAVRERHLLIRIPKTIPTPTRILTLTRRDLRLSTLLLLVNLLRSSGIKRHVMLYRILKLVLKCMVMNLFRRYLIIFILHIRHRISTETRIHIRKPMVTLQHRQRLTFHHASAIEIMQEQT